MEPLHGAVRSDEQQDLSLVRAQKSVCLLTATKPIRAGRDGGGGGGGGGFFISGEGPKMEKKWRRGWRCRWRCRWGWHRLLRPPASPPTSHCGSLVVVVMNGGLVSAAGLAAGQDREEVSLTVGPLGQPGLCWVLLIEASQQIKHHNTRPSPNTTTRTEPDLHRCLEAKCMFTQYFRQILCSQDSYAFVL